MYKSPIETIYGELQTQMVQEGENMVMKAIRKAGVNVDKEELIKALQYDRNQYTEGYADGKNDVLDKIKAEIQEKGFNSPLMNPVFTMTEILYILDKYKAESEEKE